MANNRIFYPHVAVGLAPADSTSFTEVHGVQEVGISANFDLEAIQEIGQHEVYEDVENKPQIEITLDKVLDGYPLIYHLATQGGGADTLAGRGNQQCVFACSIFDDDQDSASGTPLREVQSSGLYADSLRYEIPSEGNCTESVTLKGNHLLWKSSSFDFTGTLFDNTDQPLALTSGLGGVQRRENVVFAGATLSDVTLLPHGFNGIPGISASGTNDKTGDVYGAHVSRISVSTDLNREELTELGRRFSYFRAIQFPVDVTTDIEVISTLGTQISATEEGVVSGVNSPNKKIVIVLEDGLKLDLGTRNKLQSAQFGNLSANGGNATDSYSYRNRSSLSVTHPQQM